MSVNTKKIVVTGSSSGIGAAIVRRLLDDGKTVLGVSRRHPYNHAHYHGYTVDFSEVHGLEEHFKALVKAHQDIDVVICSAGYGHFSGLEEFSFEQMQTMMQVNFLSQALLIKYVLPQLKQRSHTKVIVIGSECALQGQKRGTLYCASKYALRGFVASLRMECRSAGVAVSMINPGMVDTPFFDGLSFRPGNVPDNSIDVEQISDMLQLLLCMDNRCLVEEINCQPLKKVIDSW